MPALRFTSSFALAISAIGIIGTLLIGCASSPPPRAAAAPDPQLLRTDAARGYEPVEHHKVVSSSHDWTVAGRPQHLLLLRPEHNAPVPLVVYLPGLGETAAAGSAWRETWAAAGYAVLAVQTLPEDAAAWQSDLAREGAFRALGQRHYAGAWMARRAQALADVLTEARRRSAAGEVAWQGLDWSRVAVAGYDLGAFTAMLLAGEQVRGAEGAAARLDTAVALRAVIALSPFVNVSDGAMDSRYRAIRGPVLSVTSDIDNDPLGLVAGAVQRRAPYEYSNGPGQLLLALQGLDHAHLSGSPGGVAGGPRDTRSTDSDPQAATRGRGSPTGGNGGGGGGRRRGGGGGGTGSEVPRAKSDGRGGNDSPAADSRGRANQMQLQLIAAEAVSTAFLDAYVREDSLARDWLKSHATRWLGAMGELRQK